MTIAVDVMQVLDRAEVDGDRLVLTGQLDRSLYVNVNKVLEAIGGKWNRSAKAHVFDGPVSDVLEPILETGEYSRTKQDFGQFDSPEDVVGRIIQLADIDAGMMILEPSAGVGNVAFAAKRCGGHVTCWELDAKRAAKLTAFKAVNVGDFLTAAPPDELKFDRVVMNPPFAKQVDIDHVLHASKFLKAGGRLVSVMSAGVMFRDSRKTREFRDFVASKGGEFERLPDESFSQSGTSAHTCIVHFTA